MNHKKNIIKELVSLGRFLNQFSTEKPSRCPTIVNNNIFFDGFIDQLKLASKFNGWFTKENICFALKQWSQLLKEKSLVQWLSNYPNSNSQPKTIALIMAGNIPLVGFHDFLACVVTGHNLIIKQSSNDRHLLPFIASYLTHEESLIKSKIKFVDNKIEKFDAVIATGNNNTARYFNAYFKNKPSIIRNNRNSIAILNGNESENDLKNLSNDIFRYYGLGCRSVSKIYVPKNYDFNMLFKAVYKWHPVINVRKYLNNYDYNKAVYIMSKFDIIENGFLMLKEDLRLSSPIATLFYEYYDNVSELKSKLKTISSEIQCIVANGFNSKEIKFGSTQSPALKDYADGVNTVDFLLKI
ncbi:MAG: acyl-CoA reductase [Flavobacteriaceae bacterium]